MKNSKRLNEIVLSALLVSIAVALSFLRIDIGNSNRFSFSEPFVLVVSLIFNPILGGIAHFVYDILGYLIRPIGAYNPFLAATAILKGVLVAILFRLFYKKTFSKKNMLTSLISSIVIGKFFQTFINIFIKIIMFDDGNFSVFWVRFITTIPAFFIQCIYSIYICYLAVNLYRTRQTSDQ